MLKLVNEINNNPKEESRRKNMNFSKLFKQFSALALVATFASANVFAVIDGADKKQFKKIADNSTVELFVKDGKFYDENDKEVNAADYKESAPADKASFFSKTKANVKWAVNPFSVTKSIADKWEVAENSKKRTALKVAVSAGYVAPVVAGISFGIAKGVSSKFKKTVVKAILANKTLTQAQVQDILPSNDEVTTLVAEFNAQKDEEVRNAIAQKLAEIANQNQSFAQKVSAVFGNKNEAAPAA